MTNNPVANRQVSVPARAIPAGAVTRRVRRPAPGAARPSELTSPAVQLAEQRPGLLPELAGAAEALHSQRSRALVLAASAILVSAGMFLGLLIQIADRWEPDWSRNRAAALASSSPPASANATDFGRSYERLGRALSWFPGASTEDILRAARQAVPEAAARCAVEWHGGEAALQYGKNGIASSLALTVGHCADAVEALHAHLVEAQAQTENQPQTKTRAATAY